MKPRSMLGFVTRKKQEAKKKAKKVLLKRTVQDIKKSPQQIIC